MTHKQWFNNVLHLHPVHEEGAFYCNHNTRVQENTLLTEGGVGIFGFTVSAIF